MIALLWMGEAEAFCGTFVGTAGASFENTASQVIVAKTADELVLTLAADVRGTDSQFAMLVPVPVALTAADVTVIDPGIFALLDAWSAPRVVRYTCDDYSQGDSSDTAGGGGSGGPADGVTVEAEFTIGSYDVAVLSATGGEGLYAWLTANGFELPATSVPILDEYVDAGQHFVAAKVDLEADPLAAAFLQPLQLRYPSVGSSFTLPIRIGTTVSPGEQDVIVYAVTGGDRVAISNYPEATLTSDCMLPEGTADASTFYADQLAGAFATGTWVTEYAWSSDWCDPCASDPPTAEQMSATGIGDLGGYVTRLHLRYTAAEATQDVVLYATGIGYQNAQVKYIEYLHELESGVPVCGLGLVDDPGTCDEDGGSIWGDPPTPGGDTGTGDAVAGGWACDQTGSIGLAAGAVALAAVLARGRRR